MDILKLIHGSIGMSAVFKTKARIVRFQKRVTVTWENACGSVYLSTFRTPSSLVEGELLTGLMASGLWVEYEIWLSIGCVAGCVIGWSKYKFGDSSPALNYR